MENPFIVDFSTPFETLPFDKIQPAHFLPAIKSEIAAVNDNIATICKTLEEPSFSNTLEALDKSGQRLGIISGALFNLNSAETSTELQAEAQKAAPLLTTLQNDIRLNETLFQRIKKVYDAQPQLSPEQQTLLEKEYKSFVRNGALLGEKQKNKLREIDQQLAQLSLTFGEHVLADTNAFSLLITDKKDLGGLPESTVAMAKQLAELKNKKGWLFTLD
ncbi:MAG: M3 family peptidase, partial [Flavobacteriaceae bacterium]